MNPIDEAPWWMSMQDILALQQRVSDMVAKAYEDGILSSLDMHLHGSKGLTEISDEALKAVLKALRNDGERKF